jgi:hypothetical protein
MFSILAGPEFNSPARRPTSSLGILGAVQKQAVAVIKARLPVDVLSARKKVAKSRGGAATKYICGFGDVDPTVFDVLPNELVFTMENEPPATTNMQSFVADHQVYGTQFLTGDIQVEGFTALNCIPHTAFYTDQTLVFVGKRPGWLRVEVSIGVATSSQIQKNGIDGFAVQVSGSATINNASEEYICAGDWVCWAVPQEESQPTLTVVGVPPQKALARLFVFDVIELLEKVFDDDGKLRQKEHFEANVIGRALTSATQCQEFDIMLHG